MAGLGAKAGSAWVEINADFDNLHRQLRSRMAPLSREIGGELRKGLSKERLELNLSAAKARAEIANVKKQINELDRQKADPEVGLDTKEYERKKRALKADLARLEADRRTINVDIDERRALDGLAALEQRGTRAFAANRRGSEGLHNSLLRLRLVAGALALAPLGAGANAAASGVVALTASLGPLIGSLAAVPSLASAAGQSLATIALGTSGVGDALKAANDQLVSGGQGAAAVLEQQRAKAEQVRSAKLSLADAQRQAARAQDDLTEARREGRRELEDMRRAAERSHLTERRAVLALKQARQELDSLEIDPEARSLDVADARLRVREAEQDLEDVRVQARRERKDYAEARKRGVEGLPRVAQAREQVAESNRNLAEASRQLANAQRESTAALARESGAASRYQEALSELSPAARRFVRVLMGYRPVLKDLQSASAEGLFPGAERGLESASRNVGVFRRILRDTGEELGDIAERVGRFLGREDVGRDLAVQGERNAVSIRRFGDAGLYLADSLRHVTLAAGPLVDWLTRTAVGWSRNLAETTRVRRENGELAESFERTRFILERIFSISGHVASGLRGVFRAGRADGDQMWLSLDRLARRFDQWANSVRGQTALREWFRDGHEALREVGAGIRQLRDRFRELRASGRSEFDALAIVIAEAMGRAISRAVETLASRAPALAEAFVRGFLAADIWGRLLVGAFLLRKMGGLGAFRKLGNSIGGAIGAGTAASAAATVAGTGGAAGAGAAGGGLLAAMRSKLFPLAKRAGWIGLGVVLGNELLSGIQSRMDAGGKDLLKAIDAQNDFGLFGDITEAITGPTGNTTFWRDVKRDVEGILHGNRAITAERERQILQSRRINSLNEQQKQQLRQVLNLGVRRTLDVQQHTTAIRSVARSIETFSRSSFVSIRNLRSNFEINMRRIRESLGSNTQAGKNAAARNIGAAVDVIRKGMRDGSISTERGMREIRRLMSKETGASASVTAQNMRKFRGIIREAMKDGAISTRKGLRIIRDSMLKELQLYGVPKDRAFVQVERNLQAGRDDARGLRRGGPINDGKPHGDSVPAMLERGEYVLNREAVEHVGRDALDRINFGVAPRFGKKRRRFATGGIVALGRQLQRMGYEVGEHPAFGGVSAGHVPGSYHYRGMALDVNDDSPPFGPGGGEPRSLDTLYRRLKGMRGVVELLWRVANHFDHLHVAMTGSGALGGLGGDATVPRVRVKGERSPLRTIVQSGLDGVRRAAQIRLEDVLSNVEGAEALPGGTVGGGSAAENMRLGRRLMLRFWGAEQWPSLRELWQRESGWNNMARNPSSGAFGIPQALPPGKMGAKAVAGDAAAQIMWGLRYIQGRYGTPAAALAFHNRHNWYREGGLVEFLQGGGGARGSGRRKQSTLRRSFDNTMRRLGSSKPKVRRRALGPLLEKIKAAGLPENITGDLERLSRDSEAFGDLAGRANSLTDLGAIQEALETELSRRQGLGIPFPDADQQAIVESMMARVDGLSEPQWLQKQLESLFAWRNRIIEAEALVVKKRDEITALIEHAKKRLERLTKLIRETATTREKLAKRLERERDKKRPNRKRIRELRERVMGLDDLQRDRRREQEAIRERILPALGEKREELNSTRGELLSNLDSVQGVGSPSEILPQLPALGTLGGQIFDVQLRLVDIVRNAPRVVDEAAPSSADAAAEQDSGAAEREAERAELLAGMLREANQRTAVSEAAFDVFKSFPFGGAFAEGGVVPGPQGAPRMILAHGGERVLTPDQQAGAPIVVQVVVEDGAVDGRRIKAVAKTAVEEVTRKASRQAARSLPGMPGGVR